MSTDTAFAVAFLAMSGVSLLWQTRALRKLAAFGAELVQGSTETPRGLLRTSVCRVAAAALYVAVGLNELFIHLAGASVTFGVFCVVQVMWQLNASADVHLRRTLAAVEEPRVRGRHRRSVRISAGRTYTFAAIVAVGLVVSGYLMTAKP